jgi:hypothetical protein
MSVTKRIATAFVVANLLAAPIHSQAAKCTTCQRDARGRIARDDTAVREFKRASPKPPSCHRCEVDHIVPLHRGGADHPSNMQWLPRDVHRDKTRREAK